MKTKGILFIGILILMLFTSCEEFENMFDQFGVTVNTDYYEVDMVIPPAPAGLEVNLQQIMQNDIEETIADQGYGEVTVKSIKVVDASIEVMEDSRIPNLNAIGSVITKISTSSLPEVTLISLVNETPDATLLPMESDDLEVSSYMQEETYNLSVYGSLVEATTDTLHVKGRIKYRIDLDVQTTQ
jgi:hypothetical protein